MVVLSQAVIRCARSANDVRLGDITAHFRLAEKKIPENYLQRVRKAEALIYFHPVYDPHRRCIVNFQPAAADVATTAPRIDHEELLKLGTAEDLLREFAVFSADNHASFHMEDSLSSLPVLDPPSIAEFCQGQISLKDFSVIQPSYPWDNPILRQAPTKSKEWANWLWTQRSDLMNRYGVSDNGVQSDSRRQAGMSRSSRTVSSSSSASSIHKWKEFSRPCDNTGPIQRAFQMNIFSAQRKSLAPRITAVSKATTETATAVYHHSLPSSVDLQLMEKESSGESVYILLSDEEDSVIAPLGPSNTLHIVSQEAEEDLVACVPSGQLTHSLVYSLLPPEEDSMAVSVSDDEQDQLVTKKRAAAPLTSSPFFSSSSSCCKESDASTGLQTESPPVAVNSTRSHRVTPDISLAASKDKENSKPLANTAVMTDGDLVDLTGEINSNTSPKRRLEEQVGLVQPQKKVKSGGAQLPVQSKKQQRKTAPPASRLPVASKSISIKKFFQVSSR